MTNKFWLKKLYFFDLDDTIIKETDYLFGAYKEISILVEKTCAVKSDLIYFYLMNEYKNCGRSFIFNKLIQKFNINPDLMENFLIILRTYKPKEQLNIFPSIKIVLNELIKLKKIIYIITNGNVVQQMNKVYYINWGEIINDINIIYANEIEPKPNPIALNQTLKDLNISKEKALFIGDSNVDKLCAKNAGVEFLNVKALIDNNA